LLAEPLDDFAQLVYVKDGSGRYLRVNARFESVMHTTAAEILGKTDEELPPLITIDGPRLHQAGPLRTDSAHLSYVVDAVEDRPDLSVWRFAVPGPSGAPAGICAVAAPITEASAAGATCERLLAIATAAAPPELELAAADDGDATAAELTALAEDRDRLAVQLASACEQIDQAHTSVEELTRNLEGRQLEVDELWATLDRERAASASTRDELAAAREQVDAAISERDEARTAVTAAHDQLASAAAEIDALRGQLAAARAPRAPAPPATPSPRPAAPNAPWRRGWPLRPNGRSRSGRS
jgi:exonuclease VII small subunit